MPLLPYVLSTPIPPKIEMFDFFIYTHKHFNNTLLTSPQPLSGGNFKTRYVKKCILTHICPNMVIHPQAPQKLKFLIYFI